MAEAARNLEDYPEELLEDESVPERTSNVNKDYGAANDNYAPVEENEQVINANKYQVQKKYSPPPEDSQKSGRNTLAAAGTATQATGVAMQGAGVAMQGTGAVVQGTGKAVGVAGKGVTRAGAALSGTLIGSVVGVPLMAVGGAAQVTGKVTEGAGKAVKKSGRVVKDSGKVVKKTGRNVRRLGRNTAKVHSKGGIINPQAKRGYNVVLQRKAKLSVKNKIDKSLVKKKVKALASALIIIGWIVSGLVALFNGLFIYFFTAFLSVEDGGLWDITKGAALSAVQAVIPGGATGAGTAAEVALQAGFYFNSETLMAVMIGFWAFGFILAAGFLFIAKGLLQGAGAQTHSSSIKQGLFLAAFVAAFVPLANVWPWSLHWIKHVSKHPE